MLDFNAVKLNKTKTNSATGVIEELHTRDIAIIGMYAVMPAAEDIEQFWDNLKAGQDNVRSFPQARQEDADAYIQYAGLAKGNVTYGECAFLDEIDRFDYNFFRLSPKEASLMDPNQRIFLETTWKAIEDAGYGGQKLVGSRTGVYLGFSSSCANEYQQLVYHVDRDSLWLSKAGNLAPIIASRISYLLDFRGPSMLIDTACSSSLVAVHQACQAIRNGECDMAIAGSVKVSLLPVMQGEGKESVGIESSVNRSRTFDDSSDGAGGGEGVAVILLKPFNKAIQDRDNIYAVIKGSAVNQDGNSIGITAPNALAQEDVIVRAWKDAGIQPESISYIEAHGTGTKLGDPIEIDGICRAFRRYTNKKQFCAIGSLKTNIGHLDHAAGIAGLVKVVMALKNREIPPSIHFKKPNRKIAFEESPVYVNDTLAKWETTQTRRAGISSFGLSGTNCHIILEEYIPHRVEGGKGPYSLALSAKSEYSLNELVKQYKKFIDKETQLPLADIFYTANTGRGHYNYRLAMVIENEEDFKRKIEELCSHGIGTNWQAGIYYGTHKIARADKKAREWGELTELNRKELSEAVEKKVKEYVINSIRNYSGKETLLREICELYIKGAETPWEELYKGEKRARVRLPVYPFEKTRCWLDIPKTVKTVKNEAIPEKQSSDKETQNIKLNGKQYGGYSETEKAVANVWGEMLGVKEINIQSSFYELGGDSIFALKIVNSISKRMGIKVETSELLRSQTIEEFAKILDRNYLLGEATVKEHLPIPKALQPEGYPEECYLASSAQKRMYILNMFNSNTSYNMPMIMLVEGRLDRQCYEDAFKELVKRHESLRTSFEFINGVLLQRIHSDIHLQVEYTEAKEDEAKGMISKFIQPFDLSKAPLIRVKLVKLSENKHISMVDMHHIISDGTSIGILVREFIELYHRNVLPEIKVQYKDYAAFVKGDVKKQEEYWLNVFSSKLSGREIPSLNLPLDYPRPAVQSFEGDKLNFEAGKELVGEIKKLAAETGSTLYMVLLAAYNVLLHSLTGQEDIIIGSPISGRSHPDLDNTIGMFVNTLAMRSYPEGGKTFKQFLSEIKKNSLSAYENQDYQFEELIEKLDIQRDVSRNPLFDTMFILQNIEMPNLTAGELNFKPFEFENQVTKFDLSLEAGETSESIYFCLKYCTRLFKKTTIEKLAIYFLNILTTIVKDPDIALQEIDILSNTEKQKILTEFNNTKTEYWLGKTVQQLFEEQVEKTPNNTAVVYEGKSITYRELNEKSNKLALRIRQEGDNSIIGLMVQRSVEMIIGIMGILKAGSAYLPIDPSYPEERVKYMLEDSGAKILVTSGDMLESVYVHSLQVINISESYTYAGDGVSIQNLSKPNDLVYIIYTSGTTGKPKGVMIQNNSLVNLVHGLWDRIYRYEHLNIALLAPYVFDASVKQIFPSLLLGHTLYIVPENTRLDGKGLIKYYKDNAIDASDATPMHVNLLLNSADTGTRLGLKHLVVGGEALHNGAVEGLLGMSESSGMKITNVYGPTECCDVSTAYTIEGKTGLDIVPIGTPLPNVRVYVLSKALKLKPIGVTGEIYIAGAGLARGYINRPELTKERFIPDPFVAGALMYKTGDIGRWLEDGTIEYIGRTDHQVKIRGCRVELGEIESQLLKHKAIKDAAVVVVQGEDGDRRLCAHIVSNEGLIISELRDYLSKELPDYMIPAYFAKLPALPLTNNGKVDRKSLERWEGYKLEDNLRVQYSEPENETQKKLLEAWKKVLKIEKIGMEDNFFALGGDSIKAVQVIGELAAHFEISMNDIFKYQTIFKLAEKVVFKKDSLKTRIKKMKEAAENVNQNERSVFNGWGSEIKKGLEEYGKLNERYSQVDLTEQKEYKAILLAGATGYLGIYLLIELLKSSASDIYVLVRGNTLEESEARLEKKLQFYFGSEVYTQYKTRIFVLNGDLTKEYFGLPWNTYMNLAGKIDSIINAAANVKHYGQYNQFHSINVAGTQRLLSFAVAVKIKDYNHISTMSVGSGYIKDKGLALFTEYDYDIGQELESYYIRTKLESEKLVLEARQNGLNANIFRVGNLVFDSNSGKFQENITDNAFYTTIKSIIKLGVIPNTDVKTFNFSFIDYVSRAIILLFNKGSLKSETYHIYSPNRVSAAELGKFINAQGFKLNLKSQGEFLDYLYDNYSSDLRPHVENILLHSHMLEETKQTYFHIVCDKTSLILSRLGFKWVELDEVHVEKMLKYCIKVKFL